VSGSTLSRRASEILGVALFAVATLWLIALATYSPADPVWFFNTGAAATPENFAGRVGAFLSELSFQLLACCLQGRWARGHANGIRSFTSDGNA